MTNTQKAYIEKLRTSGVGYKAIASKIGLSVNTVKTYCRTHGLTSQTADISEGSELCPVCGKPLINLPHKKRKKFCSDKCRIAYWHQTKAPETRVCKCCGKEYEPTRKDSKYCCHECYIRSRFYGGSNAS